jgi:Protein of unknown function, DUF481
MIKNILKNISFFIFLFCLLANKLAAQVVNIESARIKGKDSIGWFGTLGANFNLTKNVKNVTQLEANAHLQHNDIKDVWLLVARSSLLQADNDALTNETFAHLRNTHRLSNFLRTEGFVQVQNNAVTRIKLRALAGGGLRFKWIKKPKLALYSGIGYMYEYTEEVLPKGINTLREHRSTNYFTLTYTPSKTLELMSTTYYQPLFAAPLQDFRIVGEHRAKFKLLAHLSFTTQFRFLYDTQPVPNAPDYTYAWLNGVVWDF